MALINLANFRSGLDRGAPRWVEAAWIVCKVLFFLPPWPLPSAFRRWVLRRFGGVVGGGTIIRSGVDIKFPWRLVVGEHVWLGEGVCLLNLAPITIGAHCCVSQRAFLCTGSHDFRSASFDLIAQPIRIGPGCWIAAQSFVGPGVNIGSESMICAQSVVAGDVPDHSIVRGNPATTRPRRVGPPVSPSPESGS
ncbi:MAG: WcaF family extracellular polysaccharide biosynthesis acetyltransferase [Planctomycetales bacterium]|nr:WcaF family extracellular polysaccharide biosynthesis acetyltransferase [Planctomycetales bacterium]